MKIREARLEEKWEQLSKENKKVTPQKSQKQKERDVQRKVAAQ